MEILVTGTPTRGSLGSEIITWVNAGYIWGEIRSLGGRERMHAEQSKSDTTTTITVPFLDGKNLTPKHRLRDPTTSILYEINEAIDVSGQRRELELRCRKTT